MKEYYEARQHLNLSQFAYDIIEFDKGEFLQTPSRDRIINMILTSFREDADAAIGNAAERYREHLTQQLASIPNDATKTAVIEKLVSSYCGELQTKALSYPKERAFKTHLNEENYQAKDDWRDVGGYYNDNVGRYLKAVIEEYARKPYYEREFILLRGMVDTIETAISAHRLLNITLRSGNRFEVKPYCICGDSGYNYHYLVGYARKDGVVAEDHTASFRLSRIVDIRFSHARTGKITKLQETEIKKHLHDVGVQFMLQEPEIIQIKLTAQGKKMYDSQAHLRPCFVRQTPCGDSSWILEFNCTQMQAEFYFFKFGAFAKVLAPEELAERMKQNYSSAVAQYSLS